MVTRKCVGCGKLKETVELIKITRLNASKEVIVNHDTKKFGRSAYLCYNNTCIEAAFKKNKLQKALRCAVNAELKGKLLNEF